MKRYTLLIIIAATCFIGCSYDHMIEVTYKDYRKDTLMYNYNRFNIMDNGDLYGINSKVYGGNKLLLTNVKYYRKLQ